MVFVSSVPRSKESCRASKVLLLMSPHQVKKLPSMRMKHSVTLLYTLCTNHLCTELVSFSSWKGSAHRASTKGSAGCSKEHKHHLQCILSLETYSHHRFAQTGAFPWQSCRSHYLPLSRTQGTLSSPEVSGFVVPCPLAWPSDRHLFEFMAIVCILLFNVTVCMFQPTVNHPEQCIAPVRQYVNLISK